MLSTAVRMEIFPSFPPGMLLDCFRMGLGKVRGMESVGHLQSGKGG